MAEEQRTSLRGRHRNLRYNAFVILTPDAEDGVRQARDKLKQQYLDQFGALPSDVNLDKAAPWKVEEIPASWGYPDRVMVTF